MKPYYEDARAGIVLYHGDCREILPSVEADVLISDPPYGVGGDLSMSGYANSTRFGVQEWDKTLDARDAALAIWGDRPYAVFGSPRRLDALPAFREVPLIWDKGNMVAMGDCSFPWRATYEMIFVHGDGWSGPRDEAVLRYPHNSRVASDAGHPSAKPIGLLAHLIRKSKGTVVDPFVGSGTTLFAAKLEGRKAIGIEISEEYCALAAHRLAQGVLAFP